MSASLLTDRLHQAIVLRQATRNALDLDDMQLVRIFNRLADRAFMQLTPSEQSAYSVWVRSTEDEVLVELWR